ncbi:MAG TPA: hypothetical protein VGK73_12350 [Polyangiaceae bacterium]
MTKLTVLLGSLALGLGGCSSDDELDALSSIVVMSISALPDSAPNGFEVSEAWISLGRIDLVPCGDEGTIGASDYRVDLLHHPPVPARFQTGVLEYCRVHLAVQPALLTSETDALGALVHGTRSDGAEVRIDSRITTTIDVVGPRFDMTQVVLGFDFATWLGNVDVDAAELDEDGRALIDAEHNADLLAAFEADLHLTPALYRDPDADGLVGPEEITPIATPE